MDISHGRQNEINWNKTNAEIDLQNMNIEYFRLKQKQMLTK